VFAVFFLFLAAFVFNDFGLAWDDGLQAFLGEHSLNFYLTLGDDRSFLSLSNMASYGSVFETFSAAIHRILEMQDIFFLRGYLIGLTALAATLIVIRLAYLSLLSHWSWFAGMFLITSPQFWGQAFVNSKDVPFAAAYVAWVMSYTMWYKKEFHSRKWMLLSALFLGFVLGIRIASIPLVGFTACAGFAAWTLALRARKLSWKEALFGFPVMKHLMVFGLGWLVMTCIWPLALLNPVFNPVKAFQLFISFPWDIGVFFAGEEYRSNSLPRYVFSVEHFLSHPIWIYPLYFCGVLYAIERWNTKDTLQRYFCCMLLLWLLPLQVIFLVTPFSMYNGVRQTLFLWPAYALLATWGLVFMKNFIFQNARLRLWTGSSIGTLVVYANLILLITLHPYSYTYRNVCVNFFPGGANGFNTDYHALSYRAAAQWFDVLTLERLANGEKIPSVLIWAPEHATLSYSYFIQTPQNAEFTSAVQVSDYKKYDYFVVLHPYQLRQDNILLHELGDKRLIHAIRNGDVLYTSIYAK
jgi:hypothetical protein